MTVLQYVHSYFLYYHQRLSDLFQVYIALVKGPKSDSAHTDMTSAPPGFIRFDRAHWHVLCPHTPTDQKVIGSAQMKQVPSSVAPAIVDTRNGGALLRWPALDEGSQDGGMVDEQI